MSDQEIHGRDFIVNDLTMQSIDINLIPAPGGDGGLGEFFGALASAQGAFEPLVKNRAVTIRPKEKAPYSFRYADLEEIRTKTTPALATNGFALTQLVTNKPTGGIHLRTILGHKSGARMESLLDVPRGREGEIKDFGAYVTYLRRYVVGSMLGVAADDDLDEDGQAPGDGEAGTAPINALVHPEMRDATTIGALSKVMSGLSKEEKAKYADYYNQRTQELREAA
ncbi:ERF superfamily protein [Cupriavidus metallidurans]|uniref:ERF family protein n=1 Tax=Cupriavidus metallidurans TaxID=119219 RepID=UPI0004931FA0|nr:ERF family protein [Cupriavidus metallidurans]MDE4918320.1 ERF family protein [Cupriavidus metallidurans]